MAENTDLLHEQELTHLPADVLAKIHAYDVVTAQGVDLRTEECRFCKLAIYEGDTGRGWRWFGFDGFPVCPVAPDHLHLPEVTA